MRILGEASAGLDTIRMHSDVSIPHTGDVQYQSVGTDRVATQTRTRHNTNKWVEEPRKSPPPYRSQVISGESQAVEYRDKIVEVEKIVHVDRPVEVCLLDNQKLYAWILQRHKYIQIPNVVSMWSSKCLCVCEFEWCFVQVEKIVFRDKPVEVCLLDNQNWCIYFTDKYSNT
jgi:hypothetical protein